MPELVRPTVDVHGSFLDAMTELEAEARGLDDESMAARESRGHPSRWSDPAAFAGHVAALRADAFEDTPRPASFVPCTTLWYVDGVAYLGRLAIRHRLTPSLLEVGGHIGYLVRPSARRRGHATAMLRLALPTAHALGVDPALVTCDPDNVASATVIESAGGVLEDVRSGKRRYWVPTGG